MTAPNYISLSWRKLVELLQERDREIEALRRQLEAKETKANANPRTGSDAV